MNQNLKVEFFMGSPIVVTIPWISFDGLIMHLALRKALGREYYNLPSMQPMGQNLVKPEWIPLQSGPEGTYHGSVSQWEIPVEKIAKLTNIRKRFDDKDIRFMETKKGKIDLQRGHYKNYDMQFVTLPVQKVTFYCRGELAGVEELLNNVTFLGKKASEGFGQILNFKIEVILQNWSYAKDGVSTRSIPTRWCSEWSDEALLNWRAPYWDREGFEPCAPPNTNITLKEEYRCIQN